MNYAALTIEWLLDLLLQYNLALDHVKCIDHIECVCILTGSSRKSLGDILKRLALKRNHRCDVDEAQNLPCSTADALLVGCGLFVGQEMTDGLSSNDSPIRVCTNRSGRCYPK